MTRSLLFPRASGITARTPRFLWADRVPQGHASVLAGPTGLGKSTLVCALVAQATRGTLPGDLEGQPIEVAICSAEDDPATTIVPRLAAARADLDRVRLPAFEDGGGIGLPSAGPDLVAGLVADEIPVLVIDTGPSFLDPQVSSNSEQDVRAALHPLVQAGRDHGLTTIIVLHVTTKATPSVGLGRILGSTAWPAFPRSVLLLEAVDPEDETNPDRLLLHLKSNLGPRQRPLAVRVEPVVDELVDEQGRPIRTSRALILGPVAESDAVRVAPVGARREMSWVARRVLSAGTDDPASIAEIGDRVAEQGPPPLRHEAIRRGLDELVQVGLFDEVDGGWRRIRERREGDAS